METITLQISKSDTAKRVDIFLSERTTDLSRSQISNFISQGLVTVDGTPAKASYRVKSGEIIQLLIPPLPPTSLIAEDIPITVVYEDSDVLVIDKPAGMVVHPAAGNWSGTLANALLKHIPDIAGVGESGRPGIVHRLDKETSGLMMVAKNTSAHRNLSKQIKDRYISKVYTCLIRGNLKLYQGTISGNISRDTHNRKRMAVVESGRTAETSYKVMQTYNGYSLVEAYPKTGRTHQIRVHFSSIGHPITGDKLYGGTNKLLRRQFLHSTRLGFWLPSNQHYVEFESKLPYDLQMYLDGLVLESL
ncbi:MAG: RNA pseudouridine synthase [Chloroflexi bacterium]|nr:RNA pseudouridine synthase [Chloroflexota bacterium]MQG00437.1 RluA family pseudouridine synthase [SAR202 cluster bacterium]